MSIDFDKYAAKGNEVVNMLAEDLQVPKEKAGRILQAVLHALRNRLSMEESFQLMAQLPMALKSIYVDHWKYSNTFNRVKHLKDFLDEIRNEDHNMAGYDFGNDENAQVAIKAVFRTLYYYLSEGEMNDIITILPEELKRFIYQALNKDRLVL